ncbi:hypothetical protein [Kordiimonas sp.]|uniref:hypothetical protein n=1 Tax=Kordiimonas sp. TaxID=1970157 RepID=UPI003A95CCAE
MNKVLVGGALVGAALAGGYFYAAHSIESNIEQMLASYNESAENEFTISYDDLDPSLLSGTATVSGIVAQNRATPAQSIKVDTARLDVGFGFDGDADNLKSVKLNNVAASNVSETIRIGYLHVAGEGLDDLSKASSFASWSGSLHKVEVLDVEVKSSAPDSVFVLDAFVLNTSDDGNWLDEFRIKNISMTSTLPNGSPAEGKLEKFEVSGGDIGALRRFIEMTQAQAMFGVADPAMSREMAHEMARQSLNYFGFEGFELVGLTAILPNGLGIDVESLSVRDIDRRAGMVVGAKSEISEFVVSNLGMASPAAAQMMTIAGIDTFRLNGRSTIRYDEQDKRLLGQSKMTISDMFGIDSKMTFTDVDVEKMAKKLLAVQQAQFDFMEELQANPDDRLTPEEVNQRMIQQMVEAYTGYYSGFDLALVLADMGGTERVFNVYSAMSGVPVPDLKVALIGGIEQMTNTELGATTPETLMPAVKAFFATPSQPLYLKVKSKKTPDEEALQGLSKDNWPDLLDVSFSLR